MILGSKRFKWYAAVFTFNGLIVDVIEAEWGYMKESHVLKLDLFYKRFYRPLKLEPSEMKAKS